MKKKYSTIIQVTTCILLIICVFKIISLESQIQDMQSSVLNRISEVRSDVSNISYQVSTTLEEEASLLALAEWSYGTFDENDKTVELICKISPKEYTPETTAVIVYEGQEYPMILENGIFIGVVEIPVFEEVHLELVRFRDGDSIRSESLDWYISARNEYLLDIYAQLSGGHRYRRAEKAAIINYEGDISIEVVNKKDWSNIEKIELVECMDDKEIARTNISFDSATTGSWCEWNNEVEIPFGSTYKVYVETVDNYGLHYRNLVILEEIDTYGELLEDWDWWAGAEADIYDVDGNPLYVKDYEEY